MPNKIIKSIFLVRRRKTSIIRKILSFTEYRGLPVPAEKKWITDLESTPQKTFIEKEKDVFLYVHKVK